MAQHNAEDDAVPWAPFVIRTNAEKTWAAHPLLSMNRS
jgi:hypothetical protein